MARGRCLGMGGKLFEPKDAATNRDVFRQAAIELSTAAARLWIGVDDIVTENSFTYSSDAKPVTFSCDETGSTPAVAGCWRGVDATTTVAQPIPEVAADAPSVGLDCVFGRADRGGKWATSNCVLNNVAAPAAGGITFAAPLAAKFGSICEKDVTPATTAAPPATTAPPGTSDSTCLKSGITVMIGMLFFCYQ